MNYQTLISSVFLLIVLGFAGGCDDAASRPPSNETNPEYDFSAVDARLQQFLDDNEQYDGISYTLVDSQQGTVHEAALGDHTLDIVVLLASASKMPAAVLLMAMNDDDSLDFELDTPIENYLPWDGVYGDRTVEQLLSNTSGIPGLENFLSYPAPLFCIFDPGAQLEACGEAIYTNLIPGTLPPGSGFAYGGAQWQLAGAVAEQVSNSYWNQAFDDYIAEPCKLEVFQFGNMGVDLSTLGVDSSQWTGYPDSLIGLDNPFIEGGAISTMQDYAKLLMMHMSGGKCGDKQVMSGESVGRLQIDRSGELTGLFSGWRYGMGWWISEALPGVIFDFGLFGSVGWLDIERGIGGYVATDDYSYTLVDAFFGPDAEPLAPPAKLVINEIIQLQQQAVDAARAAVGQ